MNKPTFEVEDAECIAETDAAIRVRAPDVGTKWIPKSQVHDDSEVFEMGGTGRLVVTEWWAEKQGWL